MMRHAVRMALCFTFLAVALAAGPARAYWPTDGRPVGIAGSQQWNPAMVSDGSGGAIVFWCDNRNTNARLVMHHVMPTGQLDPALPVNGVQFGSILTSGQGLQAVSDGAGGAFAVWQEQDASNVRQQVHALRVNNHGVPAVGWPDTALMVSRATLGSGAGSPAAVADGAGGVVIAWQQANNDSFGSGDIYAVRLTSAGAVASGFVAGGVPVCQAVNNQYSSSITTDGSGGAIVAWLDQRAGGPGGTTPVQLYAQHVTGAGAMGWTANGVAVAATANDVSNPAILSDGASGAFLSYSMDNGGSTDLYAQRLNASGAKQWGAGGTTVCNAASDQLGSQLATDGASGVLVTWYDGRNGGSYDIYAQRLNSAGTRQWAANGIAVCNATGPQELPRIVSDGQGGAEITWVDFRNNTWDQYAQLVNGSGVPQWAANGVAVCLSHNVDFTSAIVADTDGSHGALIAWMDHRPTAGVYIARVNNGGVTGPSSVTLGAFTAEPGPAGVDLGWSAFMDGLAFFQVYRSDSPAGGFVPVGPQINGAADRVDYSFHDAAVTPGATYYYRLDYRQGDTWNTSAPVRVAVPVPGLAIRVTTGNPAFGPVRLEYTSARGGSVRVQILDAAGRVVRLLADGAADPGAATVAWDGTTATGMRAPAGVYFARVESGSARAVCRLVWIP